MSPDSDLSNPVAVLIEWHAPSLTPEAARDLAEATNAAFRRVPGLLDIRFFGDFATGTHYYLQTWVSHEAHEAYMASPEMAGIRALAMPYVEGRVSRRIMDDYSATRRP